MSAAQNGTADDHFVEALCNTIRQGVPYTDGVRIIPGAAPNNDAGRAIIVETIATARRKDQINPTLTQQLLQELATACAVTTGAVMQEFAAANKNQSHEVATEDNIALEFAARTAPYLRYDHGRGKWYHWTGDHWKMDATQHAFDYARKMTRTFSLRADSGHLAVYPA